MTRPSVLTGGVGLVINDLFETMELADVVSDKVMAGHELWGSQATGESGNIISLPLGIRPFLTCWRMDWLNQAGIDPAEVDYRAGSLHWYDDMPEIYEKLLQTDIAQQEDYYPDATGMKQSDEEYMALYIPEHGGSLSGVVDITGTEATIDSPEARKAVQMQVDYLAQGYFDSKSINMGDEESTTDHWAGKIGINHIQDSTDLWADYQSEQPDNFENGFYKWGLPMNAGTKAALAWQPALGFMKAAFDSQAEREAAADFIDFWVAKPENALFNSKTLGFVPPAPKTMSEQD